MTQFRIIEREVPTVVEPEEVEKELGQVNIEDVAGLEEALAGRINSRPTTGQKQVLGMVWDPINDEFIVEVAATAES